MTHRLLLERNPCETRAALLEEGRLVELAVEPARDAGHVGEIYKGRVSRVVPAIDAAFVDLGLERDAFLFVDDLVTPVTEEAEAPAIDRVLRPGQDVLVQVVKDALPGKGARITMQVALPGRLLVLLPFGRSQAVSRRLTEPAERERLLALAEELAPSGATLIVRTAAAGADREQMAAEMAELGTRWEEVRRRLAEVRPPARLHGDLEPALRAVRDRFGGEVEELWLDGEGLWEEVRAFLATRAPELVERLRREPAEGELFERFGVERAIESVLESRVGLPSGGHLVIQPTEALVAVDVNSGSNLTGDSLAQTALDTNLEAACEVARQLRLRDLSGIIVVDFIDMESIEHRAQLLERLAGELARDRTRSQVSPISEFGLVAITRQRDRGNLYRRLTRPCPECGGRGAVRSPAALGAALWRQVLREARRRPDGPVVARLDP
ncbi:MAG: Rne/Rng family ribonuclease, partial [Thermoanaerobaculia bacterium]